MTPSRQHYDNGVAENSVTGRRYKRIVRAVKNIENGMCDRGVIKAVLSVRLSDVEVVRGAVRPAERGLAATHLAWLGGGAAESRGDLRSGRPALAWPMRSSVARSYLRRDVVS